MTLTAEIIRKAGGVKNLAKKLKLSEASIYRWPVRGIPLKYWPPLIQYFGFTANELLAADEQAKRVLS